jgi:hypothetical protein
MRNGRPLNDYVDVPALLSPADWEPLDQDC